MFDTTGHNIGDYYTPTSVEDVWPEGRNIALKYVLDGSGNIAEVYACTKFAGLTNPVCLRGGTEYGEYPSNFYNANIDTVDEIMSHFSDVNCSSYNGEYRCKYKNDWFELSFYESGYSGVANNLTGAYCTIDDNTTSCTDKKG